MYEICTLLSSFGQKMYGPKVLNLLPFRFFKCFYFLQFFDNSVRPFLYYLFNIALNPPPPSVSLKGRGGPLLLPSVVHALSPLLTALRPRQGVPPLLPSNVPAPLAQISALSLQQGRPRLQTSAVIPPPPISALFLQQ